MDFCETFLQVFQHTHPGREAARSLGKPQQGKRRVRDYTIEFWTVAAEWQSGWIEIALADAFFWGLLETLEDHLKPLELPVHLEPMIALACKVDNWLWEREGRIPRSHPPPSLQPEWAVSRVRKSSVSSVSSAPSVPAKESMQLGRTGLPPEERQRHVQAGMCFYCTQSGHFLASCPIRKAGGGGKVRPILVSQTSVPSSTPCRLTPAEITSPSLSLSQH